MTTLAEIPREFFINGTGLPVRPEEYSFGFAYEELPPQGNIPYLPDIAPFGPTICTGGRVVAFAGCSSLDTIVECLQIQGARGAYKELTPLRWDESLLYAAKKRFSGWDYEAIMVLPADLIPGCNESNYERLFKRYDQAAMKQGFRFSLELNRYVYELK
ncbi:hypothetical protein D6774_02870 [Candidatus Woesearchaeota archaeon]|nr:MAG: hypothetical protein D6774_02870 [Candidatus Woesearchaeota archaeon]